MLNLCDQTTFGKKKLNKLSIALRLSTVNIVTEYLQFSDINDYIAIGSEFFPDADWGNAIGRFEKMFQRWNKGIIIFRVSNRILGYATLWPLTKESFALLEKGKLQDHHINADCINEPPIIMHKYWILTAIAVAPSDKLQRRTVIIALLEAIKQELYNHSPCEVLAHASTSHGLRFLLRTGFRQIDASLNVYKWSYSNG